MYCPSGVCWRIVWRLALGSGRPPARSAGSWTKRGDETVDVQRRRGRRLPDDPLPNVLPDPPAHPQHTPQEHHQARQHELLKKGERLHRPSESVAPACATRGTLWAYYIPFVSSTTSDESRRAVRPKAGAGLRLSSVVRRLRLGPYSWHERRNATWTAGRWKRVSLIRQMHLHEKGRTHDQVLLGDENAMERIPGRATREPAPSVWHDHPGRRRHDPCPL